MVYTKHSKQSYCHIHIFIYILLHNNIILVPPPSGGFSCVCAPGFLGSHCELAAEGGPAAGVPLAALLSLLGWVLLLAGERRGRWINSCTLGYSSEFKNETET